MAGRWKMSDRGGYYDANDSGPDQYQPTEQERASVMPSNGGGETDRIPDPTMPGGLIRGGPDPIRDYFEPFRQQIPDPAGANNLYESDYDILQRFERDYNAPDREQVLGKMREMWRQAAEQSRPRGPDFPGRRPYPEDGQRMPFPGVPEGPIFGRRPPIIDGDGGWGRFPDDGSPHIMDGQGGAGANKPPMGVPRGGVAGAVFANSGDEINRILSEYYQQQRSGSLQPPARRGGGVGRAAASALSGGRSAGRVGIGALGGLFR